MSVERSPSLEQHQYVADLGAPRASRNWPEPLARDRDGSRFPKVARATDNLGSDSSLRQSDVLRPILGWPTATVRPMSQSPGRTPPTRVAHPATTEAAARAASGTVRSLGATADREAVVCSGAGPRDPREALRPALTSAMHSAKHSKTRKTSNLNSGSPCVPLPRLYRFRSEKGLNRAQSISESPKALSRSGVHTRGFALIIALTWSTLASR
jgi:hypothetical protein